MNMTYPSFAASEAGSAELARSTNNKILAKGPAHGNDSLLIGGPQGRSVQDPWSSLRLLSSDVREHLFHEAPPLVDLHRSHPASQAVDLLRTRLVTALTQQGWSSIAVVAPTTGCGSTFTAVNLAQSLARVPGSRTVLMDLDQRSPGVAKALGIQGDYRISTYLSGETPMESHLKRSSETLALGLNTETNQNASEQMHSDMTALILEEMQDTLMPDVVLYDMPAALEYDDMAAFLPQVDGVLLVVDGTKTTKAQIIECERILEGQAQLLGVVLNRGRAC